MKVALVHDYLREYGGAERVVEVLHELYPDAPLFTSFVDWQQLGIHAERFKDWDIRVSWAQNIIMRKLHSPLRFLAPLVWESFDFSQFNLVISSSGWYMCKGIVTGPHTTHISYIHHPPRNLYGYDTGSLAKLLPVRIYAGMINPFLRMFDYHASQRPDYLIANSQETARRIQKFYRREAGVIYPPVGDPSSASGRTQDDASALNSLANTSNTTYNIPNTEYYLSVGRITGAKHVDLIVETCLKLQKKLIVIGDGNDRASISQLSQVNGQQLVKFVGAVSDEELWDYYAGAKAFIFAAKDEDFGIAPVEAMAHGCPVIAYRSGGVQETVVEEKTGLFFDELTVEALAKAIQHFDDSNHRSVQVMRRACRIQAKKFSTERFKKELQAFVQKVQKPSVSI